jgi:arylamine N-acetyltransferase
MAGLKSRPTYTDDQLSIYFAQVFPSWHSFHSISTFKNALTDDPIAALSALQLYHLAAIPWGDVALHYSKERKLFLEEDALFEKLVIRKLGGYCMENNTFFAAILRSLGIQVYVTGGRISNIVDKNGNDPEGFGGLSVPIPIKRCFADNLNRAHMVILATINNKVYHIDVGFGNFGTLSPIPMEHGASVDCVPGLVARLVFRSIAEYTTDQKLWVLEIKDNHSSDWFPGYCFSTLEFLPQDFRTINYRMMTDPTSWFTYTVVLSRVALKEGKDEAEGTITIFGDTIQKRVSGGPSVVIEVFKSEEQRVKALERWFGVVLDEEEIKAIEGFVSEIRAESATSTRAEF